CSVAVVNGSIDTDHSDAVAAEVSGHDRARIGSVVREDAGILLDDGHCDCSRNGDRSIVTYRAHISADTARVAHLERYLSVDLSGRHKEQRCSNSVEINLNAGERGGIEILRVGNAL